MSIRKINSHIAARANSLVTKMFVETAAKNYILARWSYLNCCDLDFYWLSAQAVEKYLKATLLFNDQPTISYGHDIEKLYSAVLKLDPRIDFGEITRPKQLNGIVAWTNETFSGFIHRLNDMGDPNNRYMLYGYVLRGDELYKLDQIIWQLHRYCRPLRDIVSRKGLNQPDIEIDWVHFLKENKNTFHIFGTLEELVRNKKKSDHALRQIFLKHNFAFAPRTARAPTIWRTASANPPLVELFTTLKNPNAPFQSRSDAANVFRWLLENVYISPKDRKIIESALQSFKKA